MGQVYVYVTPDNTIGVCTGDVGDEVQGGDKQTVSAVNLTRDEASIQMSSNFM